MAVIGGNSLLSFGEIHSDSISEVLPVDIASAFGFLPRFFINGSPFAILSSRRFNVLCHRFLMQLSVRPGRKLAIIVHWFPYF
jgi:hypothetical protein